MITVATIITLALILTWISTGKVIVSNWLSMTGFLALGTGILFGGWALLNQQEKLPRWLLNLLIGAALLRLLTGALWQVVLPRFGYGSASELKGYVMSDAHKRDRVAWELAQSKKSLLTVFTQYRKADQYGGMLFLSAALYRGLGGESHQPLEMVVVTAAFSALSVPLIWAFTRRGWQENPSSERIAQLSAWGMALYPEAVLLGSSQMREAFLIPLTLAAFYGMACYRQQHSWVAPAWIISALLLTLSISPPTAVLIVLALAVVGLVWGLGVNLFRKRLFFWIGLGIFIVMIFLTAWFYAQRLSNKPLSNPLEALSWWLRYSGQWQAHLVERSSGWVQEIFSSTPSWLHTPFLLVYGAVQPFLPAAVLDLSGAWVWRLIAIWRALGWTLMLPLIIYAPLCAIRRTTRDRLALGLSLVVWLAILINAFRGGGDAWDNVRYRAAFAGLQISLAAWAWISFRTTGDPWLRRALIMVVAVLIWFVPWYLMRYIHMPWLVKSPLWTLVLGLLTATGIIMWDVLRKKKSG